MPVAYGFGRRPRVNQRSVLESMMFKLRAFYEWTARRPRARTSAEQAITSNCLKLAQNSGEVPDFRRTAPIRQPVQAYASRSNPQPARHQRSTSNQSLRAPAARDTIGLHLPQLAGESANGFCLPPAFAEPLARQAVFDFGR